MNIQSLEQYQEMMDEVMFVEEWLYSLQCELRDIGPLQPNQFMQHLLSIPCLGIEQRIMCMIRQSMHQNQNERAIMKYIYIIDKLIKISNFIPAIHTSIVDIYSDLFMFLLMQKCQNEIEQLKILRKYWVGKLHPLVLKQIKDNLLVRTNIDIDSGFKQETIKQIRNYYSSKLQLSPEDINFHLPQPTKLIDQNRINNRYMVQPKSIYTLPQNNNYSLSYNPNRYNLPPIAFNPYPQPQSLPQQQQLQMQIQNFPQVVQNNNPTGLPDISLNILNDQIKRKRYASEETRVAMNGMVPNEPVQPKPRKIQHKIQVIIDYKYMLSKLKQMNSFSCRECGLQFCTNEASQNHKNEHIKEKLTKIDKNYRINKISGMKTAEDWICGQDNQNLTMNKFSLPMSSGVIIPKKCDFCCSELNMQFKNNNWIYVNATLVTINGKQTIIHKSCQIALQISSESDSDREQDNF